MRVGSVIMSRCVIRLVVVVAVIFCRRLLLDATGKCHIDLGGLDSTSVHLLNRDPNITEAQSPRQLGQPLRPGTGCQQRAKHHVAADSGYRVENRKLSIRHRLTICDGAWGDGRPKRSEWIEPT